MRPLRDTVPRREGRRAVLAAVVFGAAWLAAGSPGEAQAPLMLAVIVHPQVPPLKLSEAELAALFSGAIRTWSDGEGIRLFNLAAGSPPRAEFDRVVLKMTPDQSARFWLDKRIRGEGVPPRQVPSAELLVRLIAALPGSISYVPEDKVGKGVRVVARVRGGRVVAP